MGAWVLEIFAERSGSDFSHKKGGVGEIKGLFDFFSFSSDIFLWVFGVLFIYTNSVSIIRASQEELSFIPCNQQIYDFYKWVIFENKDIVESKFLASVNYSCNTDINK